MDCDYSGAFNSHSGNTNISGDANCHLESGSSFNIGGSHSNHHSHQNHGVDNSVHGGYNTGNWGLKGEANWGQSGNSISGGVVYHW